MNREQQIYNYLISLGLEPGVAAEQAAAIVRFSNAGNFQSSRTTTDDRNFIADQNMLGGLDPGAQHVLDNALYDTRSFDSGTSAELAGANPEYFGGYRGFGGDVQAQYNAALQAAAEAMKVEAYRRGSYLSQENALRMAKLHIGDINQFRAKRDVLNTARPDSLKDTAANIGLDIPMGLITGVGADEGKNLGHDIAKTFGMLPDEAAVANKAKVFRDLQKALIPASPTPAAAASVGPVKALQQAFAQRRIDIDDAIKAYTHLNQTKGTILGEGLKSIFPSLALASAGAEALGANDRGDTAWQHLQRLSRIGGQDKQVDAGDYARAGISLPAQLAAQGYTWTTLPARAIQGLKHNPLGSLLKVGPLGSAAISAAELAPDLFIQNFGKYLGLDRSNYELAMKDRNVKRQFDLDSLSNTGTAAPTNWKDTLSFGQRGIFGRMVRGYDKDQGLGMRAFQTLMDVGQSAGDILTLPIGIAANIAGTGGGLTDYIAGTGGLGSIARSVVDPSRWGLLRSLMRDDKTLDEAVNKYESTGKHITETDTAKAKENAAAKSIANPTAPLPKKENTRNVEAELAAANSRIARMELDKLDRENHISVEKN